MALSAPPVLQALADLLVPGAAERVVLGVLLLVLPAVGVELDDLVLLVALDVALREGVLVMWKSAPIARWRMSSSRR